MLPKDIIDLLRDLSDAGDCHFDHHHYCLPHSWYAADPMCPYSRAKIILDVYEKQQEAMKAYYDLCQLVSTQVAVCLDHNRFIPCRQCIPLLTPHTWSTDPEDIERVRKYQSDSKYKPLGHKDGTT